MTPPKPTLRNTAERYYKNLEADIKGVWLCIVIMGMVNFLAILYVVDQQAKILKLLKTQSTPSQDVSPPQGS